MKFIACALPLLAGAPSVMAAQVTIALPRVQRPVVRATLGPIAVVATVGGRGVSVRATPGVTRPTAPSRTATKGHATAAGILATAKRYVGDPLCLWRRESYIRIRLLGFRAVCVWSTRYQTAAHFPGAGIGR